MKLIFTFFLVCIALLHSSVIEDIEDLELIESNHSFRDSQIDGAISYNGDYTFSYVIFFAYELNTDQVYYFPLTGLGEYSISIQSGDYYFYTLGMYESGNEFAYGIYPNCLYPELIQVEDSQSYSNIDIEIFDYSPMYLNYFIGIEYIDDIEVLPLENFRMPLRPWQQYYLNTDFDNVNLVGSRLFGFIGSSSIEEILFEPNAVWCPQEMSVNDFWTTAYTSRTPEYDLIAYYSDMQVIATQIVDLDNVEYQSFITESFDSYSNLIKKWFVENIGIVKEKKIRYYEDIPYTHMNLWLFDYVVEDGFGMMPIGENNRWLYNLRFLEYPTDLISINSENSVLLKWDPPYGTEPDERDDIDWLGYHIYLDGELFQTVDATQTEYLIENPIGEHEYYIASYNDDGDSDPSNTIIVSWTDTYDIFPNVVSNLSQNYPNPFNPNTLIKFSVSEKSDISIEIFNLRGQKIRVLTNKKYDIGEHAVNWDGRDDLGTEVKSGVYFYRLLVNNVTVDKRKCILLK